MPIRNESGTGSEFVGLKTFTANTAIVANSATYVDLSGMVTQDFVVPASGDYLVDLRAHSIWCQASDTTHQLQVNFGDANCALSPFSTPGSGLYQSVALQGVVTLTAGTKATKPQYKRTAGTGSFKMDGGAGAGTTDGLITISLTKVA